MAAIVDRVRPGDVISSDLFNRLLDELADLDGRVSILETAGGGNGLSIFNVLGPTPIRVNSRVTAIGVNFSSPASSNTIMVDGAQVTSIAEGTSDDTHLSFDVPDPGLGGIGRNVVLQVTNANGQSGSFTFHLEPAVSVPFGTITLVYDQPPVGTTLVAGTYDFGFTLHAQVDRNIVVSLTAALGGVAGWSAQLLANDGTPMTTPVAVAKTPGTLPFKVRVTVPSGGAGTAILLVSAQETTPGTQVPPSSAPSLSLTRGANIPAPETRVTAQLNGTSTNVSISGGLVTFTRNVRGRLDFGFSFNLGAGFTGSTTFSWAFSLDAVTSAGWSIEAPSTSGTTLNGATGTGLSLIGLTPGTAAAATRLSLHITAAPTGQNPIDITYVVPLFIA